MSIINIGELTHHLPDTLTAKYSEIPWRSIVGLRNRVAHGYYVLDTDVIWDIANNDLKTIKKVILDALNMTDKAQEINS